MNNFNVIFVDVDDICQTVLPAWENTWFLSMFKQTKKQTLSSLS
ncbi:hypothetical protein [Candidatus Enterovibrio escicola]|uniref:Mobile element protein n=1 Tax=Candidatus Enterovibrio escicola TaxID=1927127 RepID=A0A2A5T662_9GAMM|nr:hypothetical protein [Candidatus Enterovibrio escacola]PCS23665.1 hypothetical protein BTN49_0634 [Candidatus Enterovibrio escacola]